MTDKQKFIDLYAHLGIKLREEGMDLQLFTDGEESLINKDKITGYSGFGTIIKFDIDGKFIEQGFWE